MITIALIVSNVLLAAALTVTTSLSLNLTKQLSEIEYGDYDVDDYFGFEDDEDEFNDY
jgi:hypothetical protein